MLKLILNYFIIGIIWAAFSEAYINRYQEGGSNWSWAHRGVSVLLWPFYSLVFVGGMLYGIIKVLFRNGNDED